MRIFSLAVLFATACCAFAANGANPKVSAAVATKAREAAFLDVLIRPNGAAELTGLSLLRRQDARGAEAMRRLQAVAQASQQGLRAWLDARGIEHRDYWLV